MTAENNVAAQAGDEPMDYTEQLRVAVETVCEGWTLPPGARKTLETALWSPQVSPRATADVERFTLPFDIVMGDLTITSGTNLDGSGLVQLLKNCIATTKPGA